MSPPTTTERATDVAARLGMVAVRLSRLLRQQDQSALTPTMRAALGTVARRGPLTLGELATHEQVAPPTITKIVGKLELAGLIERTPDAGDRRVCRVALSAEGIRVMDADRNRRRAWLGARVEQLTEEELGTLAAALDLAERLIETPDER